VLRWIFTGSAGIRAGWSIAIFFAIVAIENVTFFFIAKSFHARFNQTGELAPLVMLVRETTFVILIAIPTYIMSRIEGQPFLGYGYSGPNKLSRLLWGMLTGCVALSALVGILVLTHSIVIDKINLSGGSAFVYGLIWLIIFLLVGIAEESATRGYLLFTLRRGINFFWGSIILSIGFGLVHLSNPGETPLGIVAAASIGLVFCLSLWLTGSLFWAVGIHATWDWSQSFLFGVADSGLRTQGHFLDTHPNGNVLLSGGGTGPEGSVFVLLIISLVALGLYLVWGRKPALRDKGSLFAQSSS